MSTSVENNVAFYLLTFIFISCELYDLAHRHIDGDLDTKLHHLMEIILLLLTLEWVPAQRDYIVYLVGSIGPMHRPLSLCLVALHEIHDVARVRKLVIAASFFWIFGFIFAFVVTVVYLALYWDDVPLMPKIVYPVSFFFFVILDAPLWNHLQRFNKLAAEVAKEEGEADAIGEKRVEMAPTSKQELVVEDDNSDQLSALRQLSERPSQLRPATRVASISRSRLDEHKEKTLKVLSA
jgi:hypothetical protein